MTMHMQTRFSQLRAILAGLVLAAGSATAYAVQAPTWGELGAAEQRLLAPLAERWNQLAPERRLRLRQGAHLWAGMSTEQRRTAQQRLKEWNAMSPQRRERIRVLYQRFKKLPAAVQERLRHRYEWFQSLPAEQQQRLRREWEQQRGSALASDGQAQPSQDSSAPDQAGIPDVPGTMPAAPLPATIPPSIDTRQLPALQSPAGGATLTPGAASRPVGDGLMTAPQRVMDPAGGLHRRP